MAATHYKTVPDEWKHPFGPFVQAPSEYGGEWWKPDPFNREPWKEHATPLAGQPPADFIRVFGPRPKGDDEFLWKEEWESNLRKWKGVGLPEWLSQEEVDFANETYRAWGMGNAVVYQGRYGWSVRWPDTGHYEFEGAARSAIITSVHHKVAEYQDFLRDRELPIPKRHPLLGPDPQ